LRWQTEGMIARQSDTSKPQNIVSAGYPYRCQPGDRDVTSDEQRMGSSISLGGGGRPESRPGNMPMPYARNWCTLQTRVKETHQTHLTLPEIPCLIQQTHLLKSQYPQLLIMLEVSLVSFIPPLVILRREYHRRCSRRNRRWRTSPVRPPASSTADGASHAPSIQAPHR
jgi:hypothetical protein